jgi:hypothetical protein
MPNDPGIPPAQIVDELEAQFLRTRFRTARLALMLLPVVYGLLRQERRPKLLDHLGLSVSYGLPRTLKWWSRGESNPRPQAITGQFYMRSALI